MEPPRFFSTKKIPHRPRPSRDEVPRLFTVRRMGSQKIGTDTWFITVDGARFRPPRPGVLWDPGPKWPNSMADKWWRDPNYLLQLG